MPNNQVPKKAGPGINRTARSTSWRASVKAIETEVFIHPFSKIVQEATNCILMWLCDQCTGLPKNPSQFWMFWKFLGGHELPIFFDSLGPIRRFMNPPSNFYDLVTSYEIHNYLAVGNYRGCLWKKVKKHPYNYPYRGKYIVYSSEFNWIFSENAKFFSEAPPPIPYPITNTSLHDINIDNWHK